MFSKKSVGLLFVLILALGLCPLMFGQANGSFTGTVADKSGSVVPDATVSVTSQVTGLSRQVKTDESGRFTVPFLPVSVYSIKVESKGFQTTEQKDVKLEVNQQREVNFTVVPASVSETVEVNADVVAVQTNDATLGQVINEQQVSDLPLNGRDFVQLATLTPGTTQNTNPNSFFNSAASSEVAARGSFSLSVGGSREQSTDWLLDNNVNDELTSGAIAVLPSIDSIQEFKVLTYNYSAEYGTRAGPTVLVTTKSGTNQYHGALYEYFRNTALDARSYFASSKEKFNLNQFGGSIGGPIKKDKTFFFVNVEDKRQRHGIPFLGTVPTGSELNGDFTNDPLGMLRPGTFDGSGAGNANGYADLVNPYAVGQGAASPYFQCDGAGNPLAPNAVGVQPGGTPCNRIPTQMFDPIGLAMLKLYPQANAVNPATFTNYANVPVRTLDELNMTGRIDQNFSNNDSLYARFSYDQASSYVPGGSPTWAEANPFGSNQHIYNRARNAVVSETHIFNANNVNQAYVGYNRIFNHILSYAQFSGSNCMAANLGIVGADLNSQCPLAPPGLTQTNSVCLSCGLTSTQMTNYWSLGDRGFAPFVGGTDVYSYADTFAMIRHNHTIKVGFNFRANQMNVLTNGFQDGYLLLNGGVGLPGAAYGASFTGDNSADLLLGQVNGAIHDQTFYGATTGRRWKMYRPFVQDDWKVSNTLTLNLGLGWALVTPITEAQGRQANFNFATGQYLIAGNAPFTGCSNCVRTDGNVGIKFDKTALEPRIGIAWRPLGLQKTVVRLGYAIYHDSGWSQGAQGLWQNPPYFAEIDNFNYGPGFPCPYQNATSAAPQNCGLKYAMTLGNLQPYTAPPNPNSFTGTILSQNLNFKQGMVEQFNVNIEQELPGSIVLTTGYAGSRATHILNYGLNMNVSSPSACGTAGYTLGCGGPATAPYGPFTNVSNITDNGRARYDSLQIKAETNNSHHGIYALLGYTWSRTFDSGMPDGDGTYPGAMYWPLPGASKLDWSLSQLNLNNQFTASVIYELPFGRGKHFGGGWNRPTDTVLGGWQVNVIERDTSGFPLFVVDSANGSGVNYQWNGSSLIRPDLVGNPYGPHCQPDTYFNTCAFAPPANGQLGNAPRAPLSGPGYNDTDLSLVKNFAFTERLKMQFRAEFFNLFNHPNFYLGGGPTGMQDIASTSTFGVVNGTVGNPRVMQFVLRLDF